MPTLISNTDTDVYDVQGSVHIHCSGNFGGGTITWHFKGEDGGWHALANGAFTAAADKRFDFPLDMPTRIKGTLSASTGANLYYEARAKLKYIAE